MNIGLGLPIGDPPSLLSWARQAEAGPFSTLGLLDRLVFSNPEPLVTLATIAGVTSRIRLQTEVLLGPLRESALLAKQVATLDLLSEGRFTLGIGVGGRPDDFIAAGVDLGGRGRRLDEQLATMRRIWSGVSYGEDVGPIGPAPATDGGPEILIGAFAPVALERVARSGDGYLCAAPPPMAEGLFQQVRASWTAAGRSGQPRLVGQVNVAIGPDSTVQNAREAIASYYGFLGDPQWVLDGLLVTPEAIRESITAFESLGADELMLYCWSPDPDQIGRLTDVLS